MIPTIKEVQKALSYIARWQSFTVEQADREIKQFAEWQNLNIRKIHNIQKSLKEVSSETVKEILRNELKLCKLVYKHDLKYKLKHHRIMRLAKDLISWSQSTRTLISGIGTGDELTGKWFRNYHVERGDRFTYICDLQDATNELDPVFILRTPYRLLDAPIEFLVKRRTEWIMDAINCTPGYEVYKAVVVNDRGSNISSFFGQLKG